MLEHFRSESHEPGKQWNSRNRRRAVSSKIYASAQSAFLRRPSSANALARAAVRNGN